MSAVYDMDLIALRMDYFEPFSRITSGSACIIQFKIRNSDFGWLS